MVRQFIFNNKCYFFIYKEKQKQFLPEMCNRYSLPARRDFVTLWFLHQGQMRSITTVTISMTTSPIAIIGLVVKETEQHIMGCRQKQKSCIGSNTTDFQYYIRKTCANLVTMGFYIDSKSQARSHAGPGAKTTSVVGSHCHDEVILQQNIKLWFICEP